jgi:hypothetical protein
MEFLPVLPIADLCGYRKHEQRDSRQCWLLPEPAGDSEAFPAWKMCVQDDHSKRLLYLLSVTKGLKSRWSTLDERGAHRPGAQQALQQISLRGVIVNNQHLQAVQPCRDR